MFRPPFCSHLYELDFLRKYPPSMSSMSCRGISAPVAGTFSFLTLVFPLLFLTPFCSFHHPPPCIFCPFLNMFSTRSHHLGWGAQMCPVAHQFELAGTCKIEPKPVAPAVDIWAPEPNTRWKTEVMVSRSRCGNLVLPPVQDQGKNQSHLVCLWGTSG